MFLSLCSYSYKYKIVTFCRNEKPAQKHFYIIKFKNCIEHNRNKTNIILKLYKFSVLNGSFHFNWGIFQKMTECTYTLNLLPQTTHDILGLINRFTGNRVYTYMKKLT